MGISADRNLLFVTPRVTASLKISFSRLVGLDICYQMVEFCFLAHDRLILSTESRLQVPMGLRNGRSNKNFLARAADVPSWVD